MALSKSTRPHFVTPNTYSGLITLGQILVGFLLMISLFFQQGAAAAISGLDPALKDHLVHYTQNFNLHLPWETQSNQSSRISTQLNEVVEYLRAELHRLGSTDHELHNEAVQILLKNPRAAQYLFARSQEAWLFQQSKQLHRCHLDGQLCLSELRDWPDYVKRRYEQQPHLFASVKYAEQLRDPFSQLLNILHAKPHSEVRAFWHEGLSWPIFDVSYQNLAVLMALSASQLAQEDPRAEQIEDLPQNTLTTAAIAGITSALWLPRLSSVAGRAANLFRSERVNQFITQAKAKGRSAAMILLRFSKLSIASFVAYEVASHFIETLTSEINLQRHLSHWNSQMASTDQFQADEKIEKALQLSNLAIRSSFALHGKIMTSALDEYADLLPPEADDYLQIKKELIDELLTLEEAWVEGNEDARPDFNRLSGPAALAVNTFLLSLNGQTIEERLQLLREFVDYEQEQLEDEVQRVTVRYQSRKDLRTNNRTHEAKADDLRVLACSHRYLQEFRPALNELSSSQSGAGEGSPLSLRTCYFAPEVLARTLMVLEQMKATATSKAQKAQVQFHQFRLSQTLAFFETLALTSATR